MKNLAVFASGHGSNLEALIRSMRPLNINGQIKIVFSDNSKAYALHRAEKYGIDTLTFGPGDFSNRKEYDRKLLQSINERKIDLVILAGYMLLLGQEFISAYKNRIINIHPSLLPSFKGLHGIRDAYDYGVKVTGVSVHFVDKDLDNGPIIIQKAISVEPDMRFDALEKKIHKIEHEIYPKAVKLFCEGRLKIEGRKVILV
jgi:phosphoribosylglycinamide formyltransferase 1